MSNTSLFGDGEFGQSTNRNPFSAAGKLITGDANSRVGLQCNFDKSGVHTVQVNMFARVPASILPDAILAKVLVRWITDGNVIERVLTIGSGNGLSITGSSNGVQVEVTDMSQGVTLGIEYTVSISASVGMRADAKVPPMFADPAKNSIIVNGAGGNSTFDIPPGIGASSFNVQVARTTQALGTPITDQMVLVFQTDDGNNDLGVCDPRQMDWIPLAPGCTKIVMLNFDPNVFNTITFTVSLGVDG